MANKVVQDVLIQVELDIDQTEASLQKAKDSAFLLGKQVEETKRQMKEMEKAGGDGSVAYQNLEKDLLKYDVALKATNKDINSYNLALVKAKQANDAEAGSLAQKRAALSAASASYARLSEDQKKNDKDTITFAQNIRKLTDELKEEESALGNNFRNVGNYKEAIKLTGDNINQLKDKLDILHKELAKEDIGSKSFNEIRDEIEKVNTSLTVATGKFDQFGNKLTKNNLKNTLRDVSEAATGVVSAFQLVNVITGDTTDKSEAEERALKAVAIIMATQHTLMGIGATLQLVNNGLTKVKVLLLAEEAAGTKALSAATIVQIGWQRILNAVMNANPVLLIVSAIGLLIGAFALFTGSTKAAKAAQDLLNKSFADQAEVLKQNIELNKKSRQLDLENMRINKASEQDILNAKLSDLRQHYKEQQLIAKQNVELMKGLFKSMQLAEKEEDKQKYKDQIDDLIKTNRTIINEISLRGKEERNIEAEIEQTKKELRDKTSAAKVEAIINDRKRELAQEQISFDQKVEQLNLENNEELALYEALQAESARKKNDINFKYAKEALEERLKLSVLNTIEGTEGRLEAERRSAIRLRDLEISNTRLTQTQKQIIIKETEDKINALNEQSLQLKRSFANREVDLIIDKNKAIAEIELNEAVSPNDVRIARLNALNQATLAELEIKKRQSDELLRVERERADKEIELAGENATKKAEITARSQDTINAILDKSGAEQLAILSKQAKDAQDIQTQFEQQTLDAKLKDSQDTLTILGNDLDAIEQERISALKIQEQQELDSADKIGRSKLIIQKKYDKLILDVTRETENEKISIVGDIFAKSATLFKNNFVGYKVFATSQALIETYLAANKAMASAPPPLSFILAGLTVAQGLSNVSKIAGFNDSGFYDGGYTSSKQGGYTGGSNPRRATTSLGRKSYTYHEEEYVAPHQVLRDPIGAQLIMGLENIRLNKKGGLSVTGLSGFAVGGLASNSSNVFIDTSSSDKIQDQYASENAIARAIALMPRPVVIVEEINTGQANIEVRESRANF